MPIDARKDGGPAFPQSSTTVQAGLDMISLLAPERQKEVADAFASVIGGMSLRDYCAIAVLQGFAAYGALSDGAVPIGDVVHDALDAADAFLKARLA